MQPRTQLLIALCLITGTAVFVLLDPIAQDLAYHHFADQRRLHSIANFHNTVGSLTFLATGFAGLVALASLPVGITRARAPWWPAAFCLFISLMLTGLGSAYYHLAPTNDSLLWDRIPITLGVMSLLSTFIADRINAGTGIRAYLPVLLLAGMASALYWWHTETLGQGDLRAYALVQFLPILVIIYLCLGYAPGTWLSGRKLSLMILLYIFAKLCEKDDLLIYLASNESISGHALKHYFAALATLVPTLHLLQLRRYPGMYLVRGSNLPPGLAPRADSAFNSPLDRPHPGPHNPSNGESHGY